MPRKRSAREVADTSKPKQLRKRLRKAEDQLADAMVKRDRAQARVEALSIIADEIRSQIADADAAADREASAGQDAVQASADGNAPQAGAPAPRRRTKSRAVETAAEDPAGSAGAS